VRQHPAFPAPSVSSRRKIDASLGHFVPRECGSAFTVVIPGLAASRRPGMTTERLFENPNWKAGLPTPAAGAVPPSLLH